MHSNNVVRYFENIDTACSATQEKNDILFKDIALSKYNPQNGVPTFSLIGIDIQNNIYVLGMLKTNLMEYFASKKTGDNSNIVDEYREYFNKSNLYNVYNHTRKFLKVGRNYEEVQDEGVNLERSSEEFYGTNIEGRDVESNAMNHRRPTVGEEERIVETEASSKDNIEEVQCVPQRIYMHDTWAMFY